MLDDKLKRALLWIYIAQNVRDRGVLESDCTNHSPEYEYLRGNGYLERTKERETPLIITTEKGKTEGELLIRDLLSQHNDKLKNILKGIPKRLLAYFVKEVFPSNDGLNMYFEKDWSWGRHDYNLLYADTETDEKEEHLCLLKDIRIKSKRDELLERLVELGLAVREVYSYSYGGMPYGKERKWGLVYVIAPQLVNFLNDYIAQNFKGEIFDRPLEKFHVLFHIFDFPAKFWPNDLFKGQGLSYKLQERLKLKGHYQLFEESCHSLMKSGAIELSNDGKYYVADEKRFIAEIHERFLNPLVEYLLEEKRTEPVGEPIKPEFPPPEPIQPDVYFQNNTWKVFYNFLATAESSIDICADTITADALSVILHPLQGKAVLKNTRLMARSIQGVEKILDLGIPKNNITQCKKLHAKFIIKDKKALLVTSCNVTLGALGNIGKRPGSYEASIITENKDCVNEAGILFYGIWNEKTDIPDLKVNPPFISSARGIPSKIEDLIKNAKKEIIIAVPPLFEEMTEKRKSIIEYIRGLNPSVPLSIYTNYSVPENSWSSFEALKDQNIKITLVSELLHAKIYLFDDEIAFISSLNLSYASWCESVETGLLTKDQNYIKEIKEVLANFKVIDNPVMKKSGDGNGDETSDIEDIRHIEFKFKTEGKRTRLNERLKKSEIKLPIEPIREDAEKPIKPKGQKPTPPSEPTSHKPSPILEPKVKTHRLWRKGRGFSYPELSKAGFAIKKAKERAIPIDKRRKTTHRNNIEQLIKKGSGSGN